MMKGYFERAFLAFLVACLLSMIKGINGRMDKAYEDQPIRKSIESPDGDIIDCIDIYKQPSLNHPLLKNHTIKMKPDRTAKDLFGQHSRPSPVCQTWQASSTCPEGTIPIRRTSKSNNLPHFSIPTPLSDVRMPQDNGAPPYTEWAGDYSIKNPYHGAIANIYLWDIHVEPNEFSLNSINVLGVAVNNSSPANGYPADNYDNQIVNGWMVSPILYGDALPRFYIYYTNDAGRKTQCPNNRCNAFVQTNSNIVLGGSFANSTSKLGGPLYYMVFGIYRLLLKI